MTSELRHNNDKRVVRTKKAIKTALFKIMETKDIMSITISELTSAANLNRRTFYTHYRCITDILDEIENDLISALTEMLKTLDLNNYGESVEKVFLQTHELITGEFDYYFHLMNLDSRAYLLSRLKKAFKNYVETMYDDVPCLNNATSIAASYFSGGFLAAYTEWYYSENRMPPEAAAKLVAALSVAGKNAIEEYI